MDVKLIKLMNGEEIIADLQKTHGNDEEIHIKHPMQFGRTMEGLGIMPWIFASSDDTFHIKKEHVLCICNVEEEIKNAYKDEFGGIITPNPVLPL